MKKKGAKKIHLNRETLRNLDEQTLTKVGGAATENPTRCNPLSGCFSCGDTCPVIACQGTVRTCPP